MAERTPPKGVMYLTNQFFGSEVKWGISTRIGGASNKPFDESNMSYSVKDDPNSICFNRANFISSLGGNPQKSVLGQQVHGNRVEIITTPEEAFDVTKKNINNFPETDGLITGVKGIALLSTFADCVPLFFCDPIQKLIGISHAGWRGTYKGIAEETISRILELGGKINNIKVIIGPSIGPCCYEVGDDLRELDWPGNGIENEIFIRRGGKIYLDLWKTNYKQLTNKGILRENIFVSNLCTSCNTNLLYSFRKGRDQTGRMMGLIVIQE